MEEDRPASVVSRKSQELRAARDADRKLSGNALAKDINTHPFPLPRGADPLRRGLGLNTDGSSRGPQNSVLDIGEKMFLDEQTGEQYIRDAQKSPGDEDFVEGEEERWQSIAGRFKQSGASTKSHDEDAVVPYDPAAIDQPCGRFERTAEGSTPWDDSPPDGDAPEEPRFDMEALLLEMSKFELRAGGATSEAPTADTDGVRSEAGPPEDGVNSEAGSVAGPPESEAGAPCMAFSQQPNVPWSTEVAPEIWPMVLLGALREEEESAEPPRPRRLMNKEGRRRVISTGCRRRHPEGGSGDEKYEAEMERFVDHLENVFLEARKVALADLRRCEEYSPGHVTARVYAEPADPCGWASAGKLGPVEEGRPIRQGARRRPLLHREKFGAPLQEFLFARKRADEELQEAVARAEESPPPKLEPKPIPEHVRELLAAPGEAEKLAASIGLGEAYVFSHEAFDTLKPTEWPARCCCGCGIGFKSKQERFQNAKHADTGGLSAGDGGANLARPVWPRRQRDVVWSKARPAKRMPSDAKPGKRSRFMDDAEYVVTEKTADELTAFDDFWQARQAQLPAYLSASSAEADLSLEVNQFKVQFSSIARERPGMWKVSNIFKDVLDDWNAKVSSELNKEVGTSTSVQNRALPDGQAESAKEEDVVNGVRLGDLQALVLEHHAWLAENIVDFYSKKERMKSMYEVCPELLMPATTRREMIVKLREEDMKQLKPKKDGGILASACDLTIVEPATLGGQEVPCDLTFHGKLRRGGHIRQKYWEKGDRRQSDWKAQDGADLGTLPDIPDDLEGEGEVGEAQDRVWTTGELRAGDHMVLRRGVSYIDMLAELSGKHNALHSFASHFWGEETLEFVKTLERHAKALEAASGVKAEDRVYYVCTFNNNQHRVELGDGWQTSPFNQALEFVAGMAKLHSNRHDAVMLVDREVQPLKRKWCVFEAWRCTVLELPLRLFSTEGEITREAAMQGNAIAQEVLKQVEEIDVQNNAKCTVKADEVMINEAIEDSPGGFVAVHAKIRTRVLDLLTFIGSLAVSIDPVLGKKVEEVELQVTSKDSSGGKGEKFDTKQVAEDMCSQGVRGKRVLLVAPAGSGKSVFTRSLVRHAVDMTKTMGDSSAALFPARVPLAEMAKIIRGKRAQAKGERRTAMNKLKTKAIGQDEYDEIVRRTERPSFESLFEDWAKLAFLSDADKVLNSDRRKLLILDGFDEAAEARADIISWLRSYLRSHPDDSMMLTTRPSGLDSVGMSSGRARNPERAKVVRVDVENRFNKHDMMALSKDLPVGSAIAVKGASWLDCVVVVEEDERLPLGTGGLRVEAQGEALPAETKKDLDAVDASADDIAALVESKIARVDMKNYFGTLKEQTVEATLEPLGGCCGVGAKVKVRVKGYVKTLQELRRRKQEKALESGYVMTEDDLLEIEVLESGTGFSVGDTVRLPKAGFRQRAPPEFDDAIVEQFNIYKKEREQRQKDLITLRGEVQGSLPKHQDDQKKQEQLKATLKEIEDRLNELETPGWDIRLKVKSTQRFVAVSHELGGETLDLKGVEVDHDVEELLIRDELVKEMKFRDFEIDEIDSGVAVRIVRNVVTTGSDKGAPDFTHEMLEGFPANLWDRPLMANLFAQYLEEVGVEKAKSVDPNVAELSIFRFITAVLIKQAARVVTDERTSKLEDQIRLIRKMLEDESRHKLNKGDRLWEHHELRFLYKDAVRGHLRLFEPQHNTKEGDKKKDGNRKTEDNRMSCQFYHLRIQEFLAAEAWNSSGHTTEEAARQMVLKKELVQLGLAPLRFLIQARLEASANAADLSLDFTQRECHKALVAQMSDWLPMDLKSLAIRFPRFLGSSSLPMPPDDGGMPLPKTLTSLDLDFSRCRLPDYGLRLVKLEEMTDLEKLSLNLSSCRHIGNDDLKSAFSRLPESTRDLTVSLVALASKNTQSHSVTDLIGELKDGLTRLTIDAAKWRMPDDAVLQLGAKLPRSLQHLRLGLRRCTELTSTGLLGAFKELPENLDTLMVDFRFSMSINSLTYVGRTRARPGGLATLCDSLPGSLKTLDLVFNRYVGDVDLVGGGCGPDDRPACGIFGSLPSGLERLRLDFRYASYLTDDGLGALGKCLPRSLVELTLKATICPNVTGKGIEELAKGLPQTLHTLSLDFSSCKKVDDGALAGLGNNLPADLRRLCVKASGCRAVGNAGVKSLLEKKLPLESLELVLDKADLLDDEGLSSIAGAVPKTLLEFSLSCRGCKAIGDGGVTNLCEGLAGGRDLSVLRLDFAGCGGSGSQGLRNIAVVDDGTGAAEFGGVGDRGVQAVGNLLREGLRKFELSVGNCTAVTDACLESLINGLQTARAALDTTGPAFLELAMQFKGCHAVKSSALRACQDRLARDTAAKLSCRLNFNTKRIHGKIAMPAATMPAL